MKILITGATGFVGKNLCEYLRKNKDYTIICPTHSELELLDAAAVEGFLRKNKVDVVIHCAAKGASRGSVSDDETAKSNIKMFLNVAKCSRLYKKLIFIGSGAVYDKSGDVSDVKEEDFGKRMPKDPYGKYKYECSRYIQESGNKDNKIIDLRVFGLFGKHEDYKTRFISNIICMDVLGMPITMNQNAVFDYIWMDDFARIVDYFITHKAKHNAYNVGSESKTDLMAIAKKVQAVSPNRPEIIVRKKGLGKEYACSIDRLKSEVNMKFTDIDKSIKELYDWYSRNKSSISLKAQE